MAQQNLTTIALLLKHLLTVKVPFNYSPIIPILIALINPFAGTLISINDLIRAIKIFIKLHKKHYLKSSPYWQGSIMVQWQACCATIDNAIMFATPYESMITTECKKFSKLNIWINTTTFKNRPDSLHLIRNSLVSRLEHHDLENYVLFSAVGNVAEALNRVSMQDLLSRNLHQWSSIAISVIFAVLSSMYALKNGIPTVNDVEFVIAMYATASILNLVTKIVWVNTVGILVIKTPVTEFLELDRTAPILKTRTYIFAMISVGLFGVLCYYQAGSSFTFLGSATIGWVLYSSLGAISFLKESSVGEKKSLISNVITRLPFLFGAVSALTAWIFQFITGVSSQPTFISPWITGSIFELMGKLAKLLHFGDDSQPIYFYPNDNLNSNPFKFSLKIDLKKTCRELLTALVTEPSSPFFDSPIETLKVHLTSSNARTAFPAEIILSPDEVLKHAVKHRKLWILRQKINSDKVKPNCLAVNVHYLDGGSVKSFEISIEDDEAEPFTSLVRTVRVNAPSQFTNIGANYAVSLTMTPINATSPGVRELTKGDLFQLKANRLKLWIEKKIPFQAYFLDSSENEDPIRFDFFPEQDFALIKWTVASHLKREVDSFHIIARNCDTFVESKCLPQSQLGDFPNNVFLIQFEESILKTDLELWSCKHNQQRFDLFFSHRQWADRDVVKLFHAELNGADHPVVSGRKIHSFWDAECLLAAQDWEKGFLSALRQSNVAVLFISNECLEKMKKADVEPDNVVLEWEETLQKYPSQNIIIFPILVGRKKAFDGFNHLLFPDEKHCHPRSPKTFTLRRLVQEIFKIQGESVVELANTQQTKTKLLNTISKINERELSNSPPPLLDVLLSSSQDASLRGLLLPLDREMKEEQTRLLNAHVPNTRLWLLRALMDFLNSQQSDSDERVLWLQGNAGVGKSVMAAFAADELEKRNLLAGMFFAKYDDSSRNSARKLIRTLCFQLCQWNAEFGRIIIEILRDDIVANEALRESANIEKMFAHLILEPLQRIAQFNPRPIVLVVDALDETGVIGFRSEILQIFIVHCRKLPLFVKLLLTSRPEEDIVKTFSNLRTKTLEMTSDENRNDAIIYAKHFLNEMSFPQHDLELASQLLYQKSGGLFVWLSMACRNLKLLNIVTIDSIRELGEQITDSAMDSLYYSMFDRIFGLTPQTLMKDVLSLIAVLFEPLSAEEYAFLLGLPVAEVEDVVDKLLPILYVNDDGIIRIFHKSVADYLTDPSRCSDDRFYVAMELFHAKLAGICFSLLQNNLVYNVANLPLYKLHKDIPDFDERVSTHVSPHLKYAALYFWRHHAESKNEQKNFGEIKLFTETKLLNWIELLSLIKSTSTIPAACRALSRNYVSPSTSSIDPPDFTIELLSDTVRLYQKFNFPIAAAALQIYITAIPFSPKNTRVYRHFISSLPTRAVPLVVKGSGMHWPACLMTLEGHTRETKSIAISKDGLFVVSGGEDKSIKIWSTESGDEIRTLIAHTDTVNSLVVSNDGKYIVSGSGDKTIKIWLTDSGQLIRTLIGHTGVVMSVAIPANGKYVVSGCADSSAKIWSFDTGAELKTLTGHEGSVSGVTISPDGRSIVTGSWDKTVKIWSFDTGNEVNTLTGHTGPINTVVVSADGRFIASGSWDKTIKIWLMESGENIKTLSGHAYGIYSLSFSTDGRFVVSGSSNSTVMVWSMANGDEVKTLKGHSDTVWSVAFSSDGEFIASGSDDRTIKLWSIDGGNEDEIIGHSNFVRYVAVSVDGKFIVSGSEDKTVKIWLMDSGDEINTLTDHINIVSSVSMSEDGRFLVTEDLY